MTTMTIPDNWLPTSENINALPRPVRDYIMRLHANTDPAGELRRAMIAEMERDALRKMIEEAPEVTVEAADPEGPDYGGFIEAYGVVPSIAGLQRGMRVKLVEVPDVSE